MAEPPCLITWSTEIVGVGSSVEACNASEIESHKACSTAFAPHTPGFHDVVQCEDFLEIQATVPVTVQATEKVDVNPASCSRIA
jgi:hypothetical protein